MKNKLPKPAWEKIDDSGHTWRLRVPGGWMLVTTYISDNGVGVFIPDPWHRWELRMEEVEDEKA